MSAAVLADAPRCARSTGRLATSKDSQCYRLCCPNTPTCQSFTSCSWRCSCSSRLLSCQTVCTYMSVYPAFCWIVLSMYSSLNEHLRFVFNTLMFTTLVWPGLNLDLHFWNASLECNGRWLHPQCLYWGCLPASGHAAQHAQPGGHYRHIITIIIIIIIVIITILLLLLLFLYDEIIQKLCL